MALQMDYTPSTGIECSASYWVLVNINLSPLLQSGTIQFLGYASSSAYASGCSAIGQVLIQLSPATWAGFISATSALTPTLKTALQTYAISATASDGTTPFAAASQVA